MIEQVKNFFGVGSEQEKEKFESSMQDGKLLSQIQQWEKESDELYVVLKEVWQKNLDYYNGKQTDVDKIFGKRSKSVENRILMATETMIPIATGRLPDMIVKPGDEDEKSQMDAMDLQDILAYHFERVQIQEKAERFLRDMIVKRYGVFKAVWTNDDIDVRVVDPRRIRIPRYGKSVDELAFLIEELEVSYEQAADLFTKAKADELFITGEKESETKVRKKTRAILEVWTNDYVCWRSGNIILKKEPNPFFDYKEGNNFFTKAKKPYVIKSLFETEESLIGTTDYIQQHISIQDNLNTRKRQVEDIANKVANPPLLIDSDVMSEEEAANLSNEPGIIIYGKDAAKGDKVRFEQPGQIPQYLFQDIQFSRSEFDNIWGIHSTTRGEREGRETLGGRQMLREADLGRIDLLGRQLERALDEIAEYWTQLIKMFYTEEKSFTILGEDGVRFVKNFSSKKVGNVKPMVKPGSTLKDDELTIRNNAILLWQNKAIGIKTLYKMFKIPNMAEA